MKGSERSATRPGREQAQRASGTPSQAEFHLRLFVAGNEPNSVMAKRNIIEICAAHTAERFELEIIDVYQDYDAAIKAHILVTPALIVEKPKKIKIFGNLQDRAKVLAALGLV